MATISLPRWIGFMLVLAISIFSASPAGAHSPIFNDLGSPSIEKAFLIEDIQVSKAVMGALRQPGAVDFYRIDLPDRHTVEVSLFVPAACEGFYPQIALIGARLESGQTSVDLALPPGLQAQEYRLPGPAWGTFFEPFDPSFYHAGPEFTVAGPGTTVYLAVYDAGRETGAYMLGTSGTEQWQPAEDWRARKAAYDRCEIGQANWLKGNWRKLTAGMGLLGLVLFGGIMLTRRLRPSSSDANIQGLADDS